MPPADTPLPHRGFQVGLRAGLALPLGESVSNQGLGETWGPQFVSWLDIGGKPIPQLFIGGYLASGLGGVSDDFAGCGGNRTCTGYNIRVGAQIQYHFEPAAKADPWIGYGIGWELGVVDSSGARGPSTSYSLSGPEFAHFMGGLDFRLTRTFGVGPYGDFALGTYTTSSSGSLNDTALHQWLILGVKFTFFP